MAFSPHYTYRQVRKEASGEELQTYFTPLCRLKSSETLIYDKIISFVSSSISPRPLDFRQNHSTLQQFLIFLNSGYELIGTSAQTDVVYLDFKKAFDIVALLLVKLWSFGIT